MDPPQAFPYTDEELKAAGLLDEGVSELTKQLIEGMKAHPDLLKLSIFALQCVDSVSRQHERPVSPRASLTSPPARNGHHLSPYAPSEYERTTYYRGIAGSSDHPDLLYRSDFSTNPFPKSQGRFANLPYKSHREAFDTSLSKVWKTIGPQICDLVKGREVPYSCINTARFATYGEDDTETLGPVVIWIGVQPGSTSPDTAHKVSEDILALLVKNGVEGVVVEWFEGVVMRL